VDGVRDDIGWALLTLRPFGHMLSDKHTTVLSLLNGKRPMFHRLWDSIAGAVSRFFQTIKDARLALLDQLQREIDEEQNRRR